MTGTDIQQTTYLVDSATLGAHQPRAARGDEGLGPICTGTDPVDRAASHAGHVEITGRIEHHTFGMRMIGQCDIPHRGAGVTG